MALILSHLSCATPRYLGRTTNGGDFVHRSFGLLVRLPPDSPWRVVSEQDPTVPYSLWPQRIDGPLDLDGDGELESTELTSYREPTVRLVSRTSTGTHVDVQVRIAATTQREVPADRLLRADLSSGTPKLRRRTVAPGFEAWVAQCADCDDPNDQLVALIDHADFAAEIGRRRQLIRVSMVTPNPNADALEQLNLLLDDFILGRRSDFARPSGS